MDPPSTIIYDLVISCLNLFEKVVDQIANGDLGLGFGDAVLTLQEIQKGFSLWASDTGAVADDPDDSLDTHLSRDLKTGSTVAWLLHSIEKSLQQLDNPSAYREQVSKSKQDINTLIKTLKKDTKNLYALNEDIRSTTRPSSAPLSHSQDVSHIPTQAKDLDFEQNITKLLRQMFKSARRTLLEQVAATITERRRRILYTTHHLEKTEDKKGNWLENPDISTCQFCSTSLKNHTTTYRYNHMAEHLQPFVCVSEECSPSFRYFRFFQGWLNHMNSLHSEEWPQLIHTTTWLCDVEHPKVMQFEDEESFEAHMCDTLLHPRGSRPSDKQLITLSRRKKHKIPRDPYVCPFCEGDKTFQDSSRKWLYLYEHIGEHIQSLARLSYPVLESETIERNEKNSWSSSLSINLGNDNIQEFWNRTIVLTNPDQELSFSNPSDTVYSATQDQEISDIKDDETSALLFNIWSRKLGQIDASVIDNFRNQHDHRDMNQALRTRLAKAKIVSAMDREEFVPADSIRELITRESIKLELYSNGHTSEKLSQYILSKATKIFAILVDIKMVSFIDEFFIKDLSDEILPIPDPKLTTRSNLLNIFDSWPYDGVSDFYKSQWLFLAPIFTTDQFLYDLDDACPLPFISINPLSEKMSAFSIVREATIHPEHQRIILKKNTIPSVAVKQLSLELKSPENELNAAAAINKLNHPHLMKALAAYRWRGKPYLIFPWATGGNLRETWAQLDSRRTRNGKLVPWVIRELFGLSNALETLHSINMRHGDLKPENILRLKNDEGFGPLVIADMGLAKFHHEDTRMRRQDTGTQWGTLRYEHPEGTVASTQAVSRRSDIWSYGCIVIEFFVWLLYGVDELERFNGAFTSFFVIESHSKPYMGPPEVAINPVVIRWIAHMMRDYRCQKGSALRAVLELVKNRLLIVEQPSKGGEQEQEQEQERNYNDIEMPQIIITEPTKISVSRDTPFEGRANSKELCSRLGEIVAKIDMEGEQYLQESRWDTGVHFTGPRDHSGLSTNSDSLLPLSSTQAPRNYNFSYYRKDISE